MAPIPHTDLDLAKCFTGEQQLISWDIAYNALCDPATASESVPLREFLNAEENIAVLSKPWTPFPSPSPQEKTKFESATAPISVTPAQGDHYNLDEIKEDSLWLAKEAQISEYAALRLAVQEWQSRPTIQLLSGLTEEEVLSVQEAAGLNSLGASTFVANSSILGNPTVLGMQTASQFDSPDQRRLRLIGIYFSTCAAILRVSQMLMAWGAARDLRNATTAYPPDYRVCDDRFEQLGQAIAVKQNSKEGSTSEAPGLDRCIDAVKGKLDALDQGCSWNLPDSIQDEVKRLWSLGQTTQLVHILHMALFHADLNTKGFVPASTVEAWFSTLSEVGFFVDFPAVVPGQVPLIRLTQVLTSVVSLAVLKPQLIFDDVDSGKFTEWNLACYVLDGGLLERLTHCLGEATNLGQSPVTPAIFAWAAIVFRLISFAQFLEQDREGLLESGTGSRISIPAPSRLEEAVLPLSRLETGEKSLPVQLAERCAELQVLDLIKELLRISMAGFGTSVDQVSRDRIRLLFLQVARSAMSAGALDFSDGLVDLAHQILLGERTFQNWTAHDAPRHTDPVVAFCREDQAILRPYLLDTARLHYPHAVEPLLLFSSALIRGEQPKENGEPTIYDELVQFHTVTQRLPNGFIDYRLEQEEANENRVALTVDLPQFTKLNTSAFPSQRRLLSSSAAPVAQASMTIEANASGVILDDRVQPYVARWVYYHSALEYFYHLLSTYVVGSNKVVYASQQQASPAEATMVIELFADLMHSSLQASRARGDGGKCSVDLLTAMCIGAEHSPDTVSIVLAIFEEELLRQCSDPTNESSLSLLVACTHFLQALITIAPSRVWPWIARSRLLESDGNGGSLASILIGTEMVIGHYEFLIGCIRIFDALVNDAIDRSVSRKSTSKALTRFNAPAVAESGTSEKTMSSTLLTFGRTLASIYETSLSWRYNQPEDRLHINIGICEAFTNILRLAYNVDDAPELNQKLTRIIGPTANYITESYLTKSENDLPTNPILSSLLLGTDLIRSSLLTSSIALSKRQTHSTLRFSEILVRVAIYLNRPWTHLEQQLYKATPLLARLYVTSEVWKSPVVLLLETLVRGAVRVVEDKPREHSGTPKKREHTEPPSLLGHLGSKTAKNFMIVLSQLDEPLKIVDIQKNVWNLLTAVVTCKQRWFALYLLTGNTPREAMRSKPKNPSHATRNKSLLSRALESLSHLDLNAEHHPWSLWTTMLEFITSAQNHWSWAMGDLRERKEFIQQLITFLRWIAKQPDPKTDTAIDLRSQENKFASLAAEILAMYLHAARQVGDESSLKDVFSSLSYLQDNALELPQYNVALHSNLKKNIEQKFPGVTLAKLKRTTLYPTSYGSNFFYDIPLAARLLEFDNKWSGPRLGQGFEAEVRRANLNLSLVDSNIQLLQSWKLLTLELSHSATRDERITVLLIDVVKGCMQANADSNLPEALFGQLMILRADLAFALLKRLVEAKVKSEEARQLLGPVWAAIRAATADFDNVFSSDEVDYYRSLLRILYLALHFHLIEPSDTVDAKEVSFRSSFRGTIAHSKKQGPISLQLLEILSDTVARGFRSLATQLHADPSSPFPKWLHLKNQAALLFANSNTIRYATSLFSWSDKLIIDTNGVQDPIYGELSLLFILSLSSLKPLAETMAVEGILSQLNNANLMNYYRRPGGMGPFDNPARLHSIWSKGLLPLCLNLLLSVGAPIAGEISSFLNAFPEQLQRSSNALSTRYLNKVTLNLAAETHSLALISSIIEAIRTAGVREGVQPGEVASLEWDRDNVKEDIEGWVNRRQSLRERVVGNGTEGFEDRVVGEIEAAGVCLGLGKGGNSS
ncbi:hypothetical protein N0V90_001096 [Kalmusia sp. IMI 367209]|nr:hypothetical protein N0V90_001096 [Kalmusia sp. IMI 367209]